MDIKGLNDIRHDIREIIDNMQDGLPKTTLLLEAISISIQVAILNGKDGKNIDNKIWDVFQLVLKV
jgi:hypothetical protein